MRILRLVFAVFFANCGFTLKMIKGSAGIVSSRGFRKCTF